MNMRVRHLHSMQTILYFYQHLQSLKPIEQLLNRRQHAEWSEKVCGRLIKPSSKTLTGDATTPKYRQQEALSTTNHAAPMGRR
jgi:flagellar biosynthesis/type III secretory pathway ATPase